MSNDPNKLENGSWAEWRRLVLSELSRLNSDIEELQKNQKKIEVQLATLSTKIIMYCKQLEKSIENLDLTKTKLLLSKMKLLF